MFTPHVLFRKNTHNLVHTHVQDTEIHQCSQHYSSQDSQINTSIRAWGRIKGEGVMGAGERD